MNPAMYLFANSHTPMSRGKLSAQVAHAAVEAHLLSRADLVREWRNGGHYKKLVMDGGHPFTLQTIERYLNDRHFKTALIIDEGRTEIEPFTPTALGVEIVDKDDPHVAATFGAFSTLKDPGALPRMYSFKPNVRTRREGNVTYIEANPWWRRLRNR